MVEILYQRSFAVARRRAGKALFLVEVCDGKRIGHREVFGELYRRLFFYIFFCGDLRLVIKFLLIVKDTHEAGKNNFAAGCPELEFLQGVLNINSCLLNFGRSHHGGKKALPDQFI